MAGSLQSEALAAPLEQPPTGVSRPLYARFFDGLAMSMYPSVARLFGYTFQVGSTTELRADAKRVLQSVWAPLGVKIPEDVAWVGERYVEAATWIVAYHRGQPVGVMGLYDSRVASPNLEYGRCQAPSGLDLARTREIARLAIQREHRGGAQLVMVGLLREMLRLSLEGGTELLLTSATGPLFRVYRRFNPTARKVDAPALAQPEPPEFARYFESPRAVTGAQVLFTFEVAGARPWDVFSRFLRGTLRRAR
jgi:hypothetical protein